MREPKLSLHKATGQHYVRIAGRCVYLGTDREKAEVERTRVLAEARAGGVPGQAQGSALVGELVEAYLDHCTVHYRRPDGTLTSEERVIRLALRPLLASHATTPIREFGPLALRTVRETMVAGSWMSDQERADPRARGGWSRGVINANVRRIVRMFRWGVSTEQVPAGVATALGTVPPLLVHRTTARESEDVPPAPLASVQAVLASTCPQVAGLVRLQLLTGARPGEACGVRGAWIDRDGSLLAELLGERFDLPAGLWVYLPGLYRTPAGVLRQQHKTSHHGLHRIIPLGPQAQALLGPWLAGRPPERPCFSPREAEVARRRALYASQRKTPRKGRPPLVRFRRGKKVPGECYLVSSYAHAVGRLCKLAGVPHWHPHQLRHSAATAIKARFGWEVAMVVLGHTSVATTEGYVARQYEGAFSAALAIG